MIPSDKRRLNKLWENSHDHDGDDFQEQITIIRETVEQQTDSPGATGAYIFLIADSQSIPAAGGSIEWARMFTIGSYQFPTISFPATEIPILKTGYYDSHLWFGWDSYQGGGEVSMTRVRDSAETTLWPPSASGVWSSTAAQEFVDTFPKLPHQTDDLLKIVVDPNDASAQTLEYAWLVVGLVDRYETSDEWELVFASDNFGVTWDGTSWWTTDSDEAAEPALFTRDELGVVIDSYANYDDGTLNICTDLVYAESFLWASGDDDDDAITKLDPADGTVVSRIAATPTPGGVRGYTSIAHNGTNLFAVETVNNRVEEYTTAGAHVQNHAFPDGHEIFGLAWDGASWWATTQTGAILNLDASFGLITDMAGPTPSGSYPASSGGGPLGGCQIRAGFLYVQTPDGLYRKEI
jgi:hypothetical protein